MFKGKTPCEMLFDHAPSYSSLRSFGFLCYVSTLSHQKGKFEPRENTCVFMGYHIGKKGNKLLDQTTKKLFVSRDVHFFDHIFLFTYITSTTVGSYSPSV